MNREFDGPSRSPFSTLLFLFLEIPRIFSKVKPISEEGSSRGGWAGHPVPAGDQGIYSLRAITTTSFQSGNPGSVKGLFYRNNGKSPPSADPDNFLPGRYHTAWNRHSLRSLNFLVDRGSRTFLCGSSPAIPRPQVVSLPCPPPFQAEFRKLLLGFENQYKNARNQERSK
jgi:hypothetical protein